MKQNKRIYISIPISGKPDAMKEADNIQLTLSKQGWEVVNPFNIYAGKNPEYEDHLCYDLRAMLDCDAVFFCKGWEESLGCNIEHDAVMRYKKFQRKDFKIIYESSNKHNYDNSTNSNYDNIRHTGSGDCDFLFDKGSVKIKAVLFIIWLICAIAILNLCLGMVSASNTIENIMGLILCVILVFGSIYTKCLTKITKLWERN